MKHKRFRLFATLFSSVYLLIFVKKKIKINSIISRFRKILTMYGNWQKDLRVIILILWFTKKAADITPRLFGE